ncbi:MAG: HU family DNA-binding protein [Patescibacteria group bacterium]|nr:HU family DNA-binding protein [Patescibacteria group bacterium]
MTKRELIDSLSKDLKKSKREVEEFIDAFVKTVFDKVQSGEKVAVTGFGTFDLGKRAARNGRDPQTGAKIRIPEMAMPRFRAGKGFKETVRR